MKSHLTEYLPDVLAIAVLLVVAISFVVMHRSAAKFNIFDLVMENARVSRLAVIVIAAFVVYSWVILRLTVEGKMTEGYLTMYGVTWIAPTIAKLFSPEKPK